MAGTQQTALVYSCYWKDAIAVLVNKKSNRLALSAAVHVANKRGCDVSLRILEKPDVSSVIWREKKDKDNVSNLDQPTLIIPERCPVCGVTLRPKAIKCHDCGNYDLSQVQSSV